MFKTLDARSFFAGALAVLGLMVLLGVAQGGKEESSAGIGRFRIEVHGTSAYVLDTVTGQVWNPPEREFWAQKLPR